MIFNSVYDINFQTSLWFGSVGYSLLKKQDGVVFESFFNAYQKDLECLGITSLQKPVFAHKINLIYGIKHGVLKKTRPSGKTHYKLINPDLPIKGSISCAYLQMARDEIPGELNPMLGWYSDNFVKLTSESFSASYSFIYLSALIFPPVQYLRGGLKSVTEFQHKLLQQRFPGVVQFPEESYINSIALPNFEEIKKEELLYV